MTKEQADELWTACSNMDCAGTYYERAKCYYGLDEAQNAWEAYTKIRQSAKTLFIKYTGHEVE